jgi:hypothetical protein
MLPFSHQQFIHVFAAYNAAIWPAQLVAYGFGLTAVAAIVRRDGSLDRIAMLALAALWVWTGIAYHWLHFAPINPAARLLALLFVGQGLMLAFVSRRARLVRAGGMRGAFAFFLIGYAMIIYPLIGLATGHGLGDLPMFGVTPCPLVLFTFAVLLLAKGLPWWTWLVPLAWSAVGGTAAFLLGIPQDWLLLASGPLCLLILWRGRPPSLPRSGR